MNQYEFTHKGVRYVSAPPLVEHSCAGCAFNERGCSAPGDEPCKAMKRADGRDVIFIREPALDAHLQTDLALPVAADPPPAPQPSLRIANIGTAQHDEQPLTLEQRVAALEQAFARRITAGTANELRKHDAAHVAPGALAEKLAKPAREEKPITHDIDYLPQAVTAPYLRMVVCAANRHSDTGLIVIGARHYDDRMTDQYITLCVANQNPPLATSEQGFIDQHGVFMTREEAWGVALAAGQIRYRCGGDGDKLFSENLY